MKRTFGVLLLTAALSSGALAIAGDTSTRSDQCPASCTPSPACNPESCGMSQACDMSQACK
jgi:hypothetical protein